VWHFYHPWSSLLRFLWETGVWGFAPEHCGAGSRSCEVGSFDDCDFYRCCVVRGWHIGLVDRVSPA
jgi:hypothetical protein